MDEGAKGLEPDDVQSTKFGSLVARTNYLAADRPDIQLACKELSSAMPKPKNGDWEKLKRFGRYLKLKPRVVLLRDH